MPATGVKLIIQIPCFNEEESLPITLAALPRKLIGIDTIEILVIDDGSTDRTSEVARKLGVQHVVRLPRNSGLAAAFSAGLRAGVEAGADLIVNTDADNQYRAEDIQKLIDPILAGQADLVVGDRQVMSVAGFSLSKKLLQLVGSWVVRLASSTRINDATSGFRAMSRATALRLQVFTNFSYTLETIIQAGHCGLLVVSVPVATNPELRRSRLVKSIPNYIKRQTLTIGLIFLIYRPRRTFFLISYLFSAAGLGLGAYALHLRGAAPLLIAAVLVLMGFISFCSGLLAEVISTNRKLLEENQLRLKLLEAKLSGAPKAGG